MRNIINEIKKKFNQKQELLGDKEYFHMILRIIYQYYIFSKSALIIINIILSIISLFINVKLYYPNGQLSYYGQTNIFKEKDGKGISYYKNGKKEYKGRWKNNFKEGEGEFYKNNENNTLEYNGSYVKDQRNGHGIAYYPSGRISYNGSFLNNAFNGLGYLYYDNENNSLCYYGYFHSNEFSIFGIEFYPNNNIKYYGNYSKGKFDGEGIVFHNNGKKWREGDFYEGFLIKGCIYSENESLIFNGTKGYFIEGHYSGDGEEYYPSGVIKYRGKYKKNFYDGEGELYEENGRLLYIGNFTHGEMDGEGKKYLNDGNIFIGTFKEGYLKRGIIKSKNGVILFDLTKGEYINKKYEGECIEYDKNGKLIYKGNYKNGLRNGNGTLYYSSENKMYEGNFRNGCIDGYGTLYYENGKIWYFGEFEMNKFSGIGTYIYENGLYISCFWENDKLVKAMEMSSELLEKKNANEGIISKAFKSIGNFFKRTF